MPTPPSANARPLNTGGLATSGASGPAERGGGKGGRAAVLAGGERGVDEAPGDKEGGPTEGT